MKNQAKGMKLDHLTFGQLYKLADISTLMRVTRAYHKALRRVWDTDSLFQTGLGADLPYSVSEAELCYPMTACPWTRLLAFLRSDELKSAVKKAARAVQIPPSCYVSVYRTLNPYRFPDKRVRHALASIIATHVKCHGVPAVVSEMADGSYAVRVATDEMGCAVLMHKPGLKWSTIELMCYEMNVNIDKVFWWLSEYRDKTGWRVNPALWPVNTPDCQEHVMELVDANNN